MASMRPAEVVVTLPASPLPGTASVELTRADAPWLQRFFDANPAYFVAISGAPAGPTEALDEITGELPAGWPYTKKWVIGYADCAGELVALVDVVTDLLADAVFHIGTFIVATDRHGSGDAQRLHASIEAWAVQHGAQWLRLGVVLGNRRAERFWASQGYRPVRPRHGIPIGARSVTVQLMVKALTPDRGLERYFERVPRDRPEAAGAPS